MESVPRSKLIFKSIHEQFFDGQFFVGQFHDNILNHEELSYGKKITFRRMVVRRRIVHVKNGPVVISIDAIPGVVKVFIEIMLKVSS